MISVGILEREDVIRGDDYIRYLDIEYTGQSDTVLTRSTYSGFPINFFRWLPVGDAGIPFFIGKTVGEFEDHMHAFEEPHQPVSRYEFARGSVPIEHQLDLENW